MRPVLHLSLVDLPPRCFLVCAAQESWHPWGSLPERVSVPLAHTPPQECPQRPCLTCLPGSARSLRAGRGPKGQGQPRASFCGGPQPVRISPAGQSPLLRARDPQRQGFVHPRAALRRPSRWQSGPGSAALTAAWKHRCPPPRLHNQMIFQRDLAHLQNFVL